MSSTAPKDKDAKAVNGTDAEKKDGVEEEVKVVPKLSVEDGESGVPCPHLPFLHRDLYRVRLCRASALSGCCCDYLHSLPSYVASMTVIPS